MKFSMVFEAQMIDTSRSGEARIFHQAVEQALFGEEMGFDCIWAVEHHSLTQYSHMSAPESFLAYIAGKTERIHIGHGVVCLPFAMNHPIKVAERIATLDILSKGRLHFGVGKGGTQQEAGAFGQEITALEPQIDESMYMIPRMWMEEEFEHKSELINIPPRPIHPKPYQDPHPPMYLACTRDVTLLRAGARGMGALVLGFNKPEEIGRQVAAYRKAFDERDSKDQVGFRPHNYVAAGCPAIVLKDRDAAMRIGLRGQKFFGESIGYWYGGGNPPQVDDLTVDGYKAALDQTRELVTAFASLGESVIPFALETATAMTNPDNCYGNIDDALAYMERMKASGADELMLVMQMGSVPHEAIMETIENFGKYIIPKYR